ncbi:MBL fold metallo-hydrolase [Imhoffiella purpurea]|uniref:Metal-dependent hydrolases of the beta-lactamase superfamily II n=1 Tax=Imhoffiella purpurea TaxID=1249627 RepID=W9V9P4_9GAMM|nr:MBL fold metallo-hydrolase [Imhoffiella purpurea]EXJ16174.1 Metal-dependent hydrolases of the beta-lactamase superfamily II [Imhoffiella purpurea]
MIRQLRITQIVENAAGAPGLLGEHGAAFLVEADDRRLLFDTGQGMVLRHNVERLGLALDRVDSIVLSHGHYDHSGGLLDALDMTGAVDLYLHPEALAPKYNRNGREIGSPVAEETLRPLCRRLVASREPVGIAPGLLLTGEIPRRHDIEDTGGPFYSDPECTRTDWLPDDQALVADTVEGLVVLLGCGHSGLVNTLDWIRHLLPSRPLHAVLGGMHLLRADQDRLHFTADALAELGVAYLAPNHCTGLAAICQLRQRFPSQFRESPAGTVHSFPESAAGG